MALYNILNIVISNEDLFMCSIILLGTGHFKRGICNSDELYKIIERIAPKIIFEETPPGKFVGVYGGLREPTLESFTIMKYVQEYPIPHLPVDLDTDQIIEDDIRECYNKLCDLFRNHSREYNNVSNQFRLLSGKLGFPYLNSKRCGTLLKRKKLLEKRILKRLKHITLFEAYQEWLDLHDRRENEMIKNIYNYIQPYDKALFLVGTEHRESLIDKISKYETSNNLKLNWNFNYFNSSLKIKLRTKWAFLLEKFSAKRFRQ